MHIPRSRVKSYQMTSTQKISYLNPLPQPVKSTSSKQMANWFVKHQQSRRLPRTVSQCLFRELLPLQPRHRSSLLQALSPRSSTDPGFPGAPGGAMNRGATLLHYDFRVVTYTSSTKSLNQFTIRAYLNNGKRWVKFPSLNYAKMLAMGWLASPQTPLTAKRPIKDHTDVDDIGEGPLTPSSSKVRRLVFDHESPSPLGSSHLALRYQLMTLLQPNSTSQKVLK
ncbi:hypothetical protein V8E54_001313 [Elaphomyces granulatus]